MTPPSQNRAGARLIYLVDDEQLMLDLAEVALLELGFKVKKFTNPAEAYAAFVREPRRPILLLTDYAMGPLNGIELSEKCKATDPNLKIVMLSGTVGSEITHGSPVTLDAFLAKPYHGAMLVKTVRKVLQEPEPALCASRQPAGRTPSS